jgi:hypothetical protein
VRVAWAGVACALSVGWFFRFQLTDGFSSTFGDAIDGRIEVALLEHWYNVFRGIEAWRQPLYHYPARGVLGYNDGYFLLGLIYSGFRAIGSGPFVATDLTGIVTHIAGFCGFLGFARRVCRLGFGWAVLGAALFTISNAGYMQAPHGQLFTLALAPLVAWLGWAAGEALLRRDLRRAAALGCAGAVLFDAWLLTAFYMAWFMALFSVIVGVAGLAVIRRSPGWRVPRLWPVLLTGVVLAAGLIPFVMTYLPVWLETGGHSLSTVMAFVPTPFDLVNTGRRNVLYGGLNQWLVREWVPDGQLQGEHAVGLPWLLLILTVYGAVCAWRSGGLWRALAAAVAVSVVLVVQVDGQTLWLVIYRTVPGAGAIRAVTRYVLFLTFPATLLAMFGLAHGAARWSLPLTALICLVLPVEELNLLPRADIPGREEQAFLAAVPPIPKACRAFVLVSGRRIDDPRITAYLAPFVGTVDAMLVAEFRHRPTLNGLSSVTPAHMALPPPPGADGALAMRRYVADRGLLGDVCGLDLAQMKWLPSPLPAAAMPLGERIPLGAPAAERYLRQGWSDGEAVGRWTVGPLARLEFTVAARGQDLDFALMAQAMPLGGPPTGVGVRVNGHELPDWAPLPGHHVLHATIPAAWIAADGAVDIDLLIRSPRRPAEIPPEPGMAAVPDMRELGLLGEWFSLSPAGAG